MKKQKSFLVTFVVTVTLLTCSFVSILFSSTAFHVSWKMHELTKEAKYYIEFYSAEKQAEALEDVNARRKAFLESEDNFIAFIANCPPLGKIALTSTLLLLTAILGAIFGITLRCNKEVYKDYFIRVAQILTLAIIFVYSKVKKNSEVFQKYYRRSIIYKARKRALG